MRRRPRPTRHQLTTGFTTRRSHYAAIEQEGPPVPLEIEVARVRARYAEQGLPYTDEDDGKEPT